MDPIIKEVDSFRKMSRYAVSFGAKLTTSVKRLRNGAEIGLCRICQDDDEDVIGDKNVNHLCRSKGCRANSKYQCGGCWEKICENANYVDAHCPFCREFYYNDLSDYDKNDLDRGIYQEMMEWLTRLRLVDFNRIFDDSRDQPGRAHIWDQVKSLYEMLHMFEDDDQEALESLRADDVDRQIAHEETKYYLLQLGVRRTDIEFVLQDPWHFQAKMIEKLQQDPNYVTDRSHHDIDDDLNLFHMEMDDWSRQCQTPGGLVEWLKGKEEDLLRVDLRPRGVPENTITFMMNEVPSAEDRYTLHQILKHDFRFVENVLQDALRQNVNPWVLLTPLIERWKDSSGHWEESDETNVNYINE